MNQTLNATVENLYSIDAHNDYTIEFECVNKLQGGLIVKFWYMSICYYRFRPQYV